MPTTELTRTQMNQLRDAYLDLSSNLGQYRIQNMGDLSISEINRLKDFEHTFSNISQNFNLQSVKLLLGSNDVAQAVTNINDTTKDLNEAVKKLKGIKKLIGIATAAVTLAGAVISGNPQAIGQSIAGVVVAITKKDEKDKKDNENG